VLESLALINFSGFLMHSILAQVLEDCTREVLDPAVPRAMAVVDPIKVVITTWPEGEVREPVAVQIACADMGIGTSNWRCASTCVLPFAWPELCELRRGVVLWLRAGRHARGANASEGA
jgi:hypothetical protein